MKKPSKPLYPIRGGYLTYADLVANPHVLGELTDAEIGHCVRAEIVGLAALPRLGVQRLADLDESASWLRTIDGGVLIEPGVTETWRVEIEKGLRWLVISVGSDPSQEDLDQIRRLTGLVKWSDPKCRSLLEAWSDSMDAINSMPRPGVGG